MSQIELEPTQHHVHLLPKSKRVQLELQDLHNLLLEFPKGTAWKWPLDQRRGYLQGDGLPGIQLMAEKQTGYSEVLILILWDWDLDDYLVDVVNSHVKGLLRNGQFSSNLREPVDENYSPPRSHKLFWVCLLYLKFKLLISQLSLCFEFDTGCVDFGWAPLGIVFCSIEPFWLILFSLLWSRLWLFEGRKWVVIVLLSWGEQSFDSFRARDGVGCTEFGALEQAGAGEGLGEFTLFKNLPLLHDIWLSTMTR